MTDTSSTTSFSRNIKLTIGMLLILVMAFSVYVWSEKRIDRANVQRQRSLMMANELRQSSDDLSRMVRTYVATGNPVYKKHFQDILDIRNGKKPRPINYQGVFWDLVTLDGKAPRPDGSQSIALLALMQREGFSDEELSKLTEAKSNSDGLTATEYEAMRLVEEVGPNREANRIKATQMLYDEKYHQAKASIMLPISEFISMVDERTLNAVHATEVLSVVLRVLVSMLGFGLMFLLWRSYKGLLSALGGSVDDVHAQIKRIGSGDFSIIISLPNDLKNSVMGWLAETQHNLHSLDNQNRMITLSLTESEAKLQAILDASGAGIAWANEDGEIEYINKKFAAMFGYTLADIPTVERWYQCAYPDAGYRTEMVDEWNAKVAHSLPEKTAIDTMEVHITCKDGSTRYVLLMASWAGTKLVATFSDITDRKLSEIKIQRLTDLYATLSQCNQAIVRCTNKEELFIQICNDAVQFGKMKMAWIGFANPDTHMIYPITSSGIGTEYLSGIEISLEADKPAGLGPTGTACREGQPVWCQDFQHDPMTKPWHERGSRYDWRASASLPLFQDGVIAGVFTLYAGEINAFDEAARNLLIEMAMDLSYALDRFSSEARREQAEAQLGLAAEVFRHSNEGFIITDADGNIILVNACFTKITGYTADDVLGRNPRLLASHRHDEAFYSAMWRDIGNNGFWRGEVWNRRKDGSIYPEWLSVTRVQDAVGGTTHYIGIFTDITQQKYAEERIHRLAHFDELTGLPNRTLLTDRITHAISQANRSNTSLALMFLDLDHFKNVNDSLGHHIGDKLLIQIGERLKAAVREEDTVARLGGDEFILLLSDTDANGAMHVAEKILSSVSKTFKIDQYELITTPSIGIAMFPEDGMDMDGLFKSADAAMYRAKEGGRNDYRFFTQEMQRRTDRMLQLENALRHAIDDGQLKVYYQPQICIDSGRIIGAEALLRWQHPEFGMVSPSEFIPIAEDTGQILKIGEWVLRNAMLQLKSWIDDGADPIIIAVNLSAVQFRQFHLAELVMRVLEEVNVSPEYLELELTEGTAMSDPQTAIAIMDNLHAQGIRMSIDDFGTGYSSLAHLKRFQVYKLKIDQSFVRDITEDPEDKAIVSAVISMAKSLGLRTIAEGVETEGQLDFLRNQGCDEVQGYLYSKPLPAEQFKIFMQGLKNI